MEISILHIYICQSHNVNEPSLGPFRNRFPLNLYRKLPLVNSLSLNQSETVFKIKFFQSGLFNVCENI
jgi:hypothetical protein